MNCKQDRFHPPVTGNFNFETRMPTAAACVVCFFTTAGLLLKALYWRNKPDTVIVSPEDAPPFTQDFSWSFTVKLVPRKTFSNKRTGDQRGNNVFKAFKRQEMAGSDGWPISWLFFPFSWIVIRPAFSVPLVSTPVFLLQQSKGLLLGVAPPVWCDSCCNWETYNKVERGGESRSCLSVWHGLLTSYIPPHAQASFSAHPPGQRSFAWKAFHHFSNTCNQDYAH